MSSITTTSSAVPSALGHSLSSYLSQIQKIEILTPAKETELARAYYENNDLNAARELILAHLRFVVMISRNYQGYGLSQTDLIQEGNIGLMKAVKRFDPNKGVRLMTFAVHWIKAEINEFVLRNWRIVKVSTTKAQRKLFFNLRSMKTRLQKLNREEMQAMASKLDVSVEDVREMECRMTAQDASIDADRDDDSYTSPLQLVSALPTPEEEVIDNAWHNDLLAQMRSAVTRLDERSRDIITRRQLNDNKESLQTLADEYGISAERIRQIESAAIANLRKELVDAN